ncbi:TonB-dependent receptor [Cellulophaga sp. L1A9]|uniref:carboxypeptidase-like regulatory domain-containing protein n=1 Tax=Cellulophaga sp. L1A9 TaxID=2686362 RepID=UPI00131B9475|nr:TonB-dependent receptor [Cellulophaga sp. L1A9]
MRKIYLFILIFAVYNLCSSQGNSTVTAQVLDKHQKNALVGIRIIVEKTSTYSFTDKDGIFSIILPDSSDYILSFQSSDYIVKRVPISVGVQNIDLGILYLEKDIRTELTDNLITLTEAEIHDDEQSASSVGLLQATKDIFLQRAAFDFGQAFFRVRGYDSQNGKVLLNGITMNKFYDGRPQWNNWGGLNDVTRNQQFSNGLSASAYNFGGTLGTTNISTRPSTFRPGIRISSSASNRTYGARIMATYTSKVSEKGLSYSVSGSRRWSKEGYVEGTLYDAYSFFGAVEYQINSKNSLLFTGIMASNRRGRSSAVTEEVFNLIGSRYNPYWGKQEGEIRNSRERKIAEPILMFNHNFETSHFKLNTGVSYQWGINSRSRLGYYNAPNPDPTYYRYLPSYYINSTIGANFLSANTAKEGFLINPQLNWDQLYKANENDKAAYVLYDDVVKDTQLSVNSIANITYGEQFKMDIGFGYKSLSSMNYAEINDLLGANYHEDVDVFSNTQNNSNGSLQKYENDIFNYHYKMEAEQLETFAQLNYEENGWKGFIAAHWESIKYGRNGLFKNQRYENDSFGKSADVHFSNFSFKGGVSYKINGRNWIESNAMLQHKPPVLQNVFINPRENNQIVPELNSEKITSIDGSYFFRYPKLTGRVSGFYTRFQDATDVNFFFVDAGVGSDFVQEVLTNVDKLQLGTELGLEYQISSSVQLTAVAAIGKYVFANNPNVTINFDTADAEEELINLEGSKDLGLANIKDYKLAQGPQKAFALGINYRDPKYWWIGATANYLANNYSNISTITRTKSFYIDPETGINFPDATDENVAALLKQKPLDNFYLLNLVGGKSWLKSGKYISVFASVNNVFDTAFRSGGYEQSRNGNYGQLKQDALSGTPSFAPKYWYGYGRTYFLNFAISF